VSASRGKASARPGIVTVPRYLDAVASLHALTGADMARALGVNVSAVRRWRRGHLVPSWRRVRQMVALWGGDAELLQLGAALQRYGRETGVALDDAVRFVRLGKRTAPQRRRPRPAVDRHQLSLPIGR